MPSQPSLQAHVARSLLRTVMGGCLALGLLAAASAPSIAQEPKVDVSKRAAALPGTVYSWFPMPAVLPVESDPRVRDQKFRSELQAALDKALQAKGYHPAPAGVPPAFVMAYRVGLRDATQATVEESDPASPTPQGAVRCDSGGCSQIVTEGSGGKPQLELKTVTSTDGALLVEVLQPGTVNVLWRALSRGTIKPGTITQARLDAVARSTLEQLPPAPTR